MAACKGAFFLPQAMKKERWPEQHPKIKDFYNIKVGVIGAGYAGRHFIKLLKNFCIDVLVCDPTLSAEEVKEQLGAEKRELNELLAESDVISIHAPSIPSTEKMLNATNLHLIKNDAILINTARGALIDEAALVEECAKNRFTVILDVYWPEPPAEDHPLRKMDNAILFPHIAGVENNGLFRVGDYICRELNGFIQGEILENEINLTKLPVLA